MSNYDDILTDEEFHRLFDEAQKAFDGTELFFRKPKSGNSFHSNR